jgi:hypothetical protein
LNFLFACSRDPLVKRTDPSRLTPLKSRVNETSRAV